MMPPSSSSSSEYLGFMSAGAEIARHDRLERGVGAVAVDHCWLLWPLQVHWSIAAPALRGVPNLKTFMALGRDFDEVKVVYASEKVRYTFGDMLPSA